MEKNNFKFSYSAKEKKEIEGIRTKYIPREESGLDKLRRLDASVTEKATVLSLVLGVLGTLILGTGMSLCMVVGGKWFVPGIVIGFIGIVSAVLAYPAYNKVIKRERVKVSAEILRLTDELLK